MEPLRLLSQGHFVPPFCHPSHHHCRCQIIRPPSSTPRHQVSPDGNDAASSVGAAGTPDRESEPALLLRSRHAAPAASSKRVLKPRSCQAVEIWNTCDSEVRRSFQNQTVDAARPSFGHAPTTQLQHPQRRPSVTHRPHPQANQAVRDHLLVSHASSVSVAYYSTR